MTKHFVKKAWSDNQNGFRYTVRRPHPAHRRAVAGGLRGPGLAATGYGSTQEQSRSVCGCAAGSRGASPGRHRSFAAIPDDQWRSQLHRAADTFIASGQQLQWQFSNTGNQHRGRPASRGLLGRLYCCPTSTIHLGPQTAPYCASPGLSVRGSGFLNPRERFISQRTGFSPGENGLELSNQPLRLFLAPLSCLATAMRALAVKFQKVLSIRSRTGKLRLGEDVLRL
jgi:hypothetical protein